MVEIVVRDENAVHVVDGVSRVPHLAHDIAAVEGRPGVDERQLAVVVREIGVDAPEVEPPHVVRKLCHHALRYVGQPLERGRTVFVA